MEHYLEQLSQATADIIWEGGQPLMIQRPSDDDILAELMCDMDLYDRQFVIPAILDELCEVENDYA